MTLPNEKYILDNFETAVKNGYIKPFFQPIIRTLTGDICGAETLARWDDPDFGLLSPALFVDLLEKNGLISKLDLCIVESLCYGYDFLRKQGKKPMRFTVNLSRIDFDNGDFFEEITAVFKKYNVPPHAVCLEITESVTLDNTEEFRFLFDKFRSAGFEIWMDDFGSGYTSLNVLKDYEFDVLKIDMKFLSDINARSRK
ncbi:MAG: EAL domain-containing protein, partial [Firmicutes bacterium]|nr:EAL domain-containing protein [Bacillota bacterium]